MMWRKIGKTVIVYLGSAWVVIEAVNFFIEKFKWPDYIFHITIILAIAGLLATITMAVFGNKRQNKNYRIAEASILLSIVVVSGFFLIKTNLNIPRSTPFDPDNTNSITVLPFKYIGSDDKNNWIAEAFAEETRRYISKIPKIKVTPATTSSVAYSQINNIQEISQSLDVRYILEGSLQTFSNTGKMNITLTDAKRNKIIFIEDYEFSIHDLLTIQKKIATDIAYKIAPAFDFNSKYKSDYKPQAYDKYLEARYLWKQKQASQPELIEEKFKNAITIDPNMALSYAGLADHYLNQAHYGAPPHDVFPKAIEYAKKALELDSDSHLALTALADCLYHYHYAWDSAEFLFKKALELAPGYTNALWWYSGMLSAMNRHDEAKLILKKGEMIDPFNAGLKAWGSRTFYWAREYDKARAALQQLNTEYPSHQSPFAWESYPVFSDADNKVEKLLSISQITPSFYPKIGLAIAMAKEGQSEKANMIFEDLLPLIGNSSPHYLAKIKVFLKEYDTALYLLEKAYNVRDAGLIWINADPAFDVIRKTSRFSEIIKKMNLQNYPPDMGVNLQK